MAGTIDDLRAELEAAVGDHQEAVVGLRQVLDEFALARRVPRERAEGVLDAVLVANRRLREAHVAAKEHTEAFDLDAVGTEEELASSLADLVGVLEGLAEAMPAEQVRRLHEELSAGRCHHASSKFRTEHMEALREAAAQEMAVLLEGGKAGGLTAFPGPADDGSWLTWFWGLTSDEQETVFELLAASVTALVGFLVNVRQEHWRPAEGSPSNDGVARTEEGLSVRDGDHQGHHPPVGSRRVVAPRAKERGRLRMPNRKERRKFGIELREPSAERRTAPISPLMSALLLENQPTKKVDPAVDDEPLLAGAEPEDGAAPVVSLEMAPDSTTPGRLDEEGLETAPVDAEPSEPASKSEAASPSEPASEPGAHAEASSADHAEAAATESKTGSPLPELPKAVSLDEFRRDYWLGASAKAEKVPWLDPVFAAGLESRLADALIQWEWPTAHLVVRALDELRGSSLESSWVLDWATSFATGMQSAPDGPRQAWRAQVLEAVHDTTPLADHPVLWLAAALLILDSDPAVAFDVGALDSLLTLMDVGTFQRRLLEEWVQVCRTGHSPNAILQSTRQERSLESLQERLASSRIELREWITRTYSAAGGKIERTHCRAAWDRFVERAHPVLEGLADGERKVSRQELDKLRRFATKVFNKAGAKFGDRNKMDRAVDEWIQRAMVVLDAAGEVDEAAEEKEGQAHGSRFSPEVVRWLKDPPCGDGLDGWLVELLRRHLDNDTAATLGTEFGEDHVRHCPLIVEGWGSLSGSNRSLDVRLVERPLLAASHWLYNRRQEPVEDILDWLAEHRLDLLSDDSTLPHSAKSAIRKRREEQDERVHRLGARLRAVALDLAELADHEATIARKASELVDGAYEREVEMLDLLWLDHCAEILEGRVVVLVDRLMRQAEEEGYPREDLERMKEAGQYSSLLLARNLRQPASLPSRPRATLYRPYAEQRWPDPDKVLRRLSAELGDPGTPQGRLVREWLGARRKLQKDSLPPAVDLALRDAFTEVILQVEEAQRKTSVRKYTPRGRNATHYTQVDLSDVRSWLAPGNPTFLPQLARFRTLAVKCVPVKVTDWSLDRKVEREASEDEITILLAPGLPRAKREELVDRLASRFVGPIAILDDLDLCRILNVGGVSPDPLLATLEILAERQPWERFCPYEVVEGQHVRMEMFVGREDQASKLAHQATYSRIFSGRRLGKTALLRYLQASSRYKRLPSGNRLHVLFCSIAGDAHEDAVAAKILSALTKEFDLEQPERMDADAMKTALHQFTEDRPDESLLILLDEADTFFEEEIHSPKSARQQSLSWWMSRHGEESLDTNRIPRVRFVLCGYLFTDQNRGVWENKGDVLRLQPLRPHAAVELIAKPLARLGVDVAQEADGIAFRCGYQPAVLIRFGLELLEHLKRSRARQESEHVQIRRADVIDVFHSNPVQQAIQEACWLNFVGHMAGQLIFASLLMELKTRTPAAAVEDVADALLRHIRDVDPGFQPSSIYEGSWSDFVTQQLRELVDRSLLIQVGHRPAAYRLRFPHHLPVLVVPDPAQRVRDALSVLQAGGRGRAPEWLLTDAVVGGLEDAVSVLGQELDVAGGVVLTQWPAPMLEPQHGLPARLQLSQDKVVSTKDLGPAVPGRVLVGGCELGRRVLAEPDLEFVVAQTGRLTQEQIRGWFQRRRAAQFTANGAWEEIMRHTAGIPLLVRELDQLVTGLAGEAPTVGGVEFDELMSQLQVRIDAAWQRLVSGSSPESLTDRELELVALVARATEMLPEAPGLALEERAVEGAEELGPADWPSLRLLMLLGVLPRMASSVSDVKAGVLAELGPLGSSDPVARLLERTE